MRGLKKSGAGHAAACSFHGVFAIAGKARAEKVVRSLEVAIVASWAVAAEWTIERRPYVNDAKLLKFPDHVGHLGRGLMR